MRRVLLIGDGKSDVGEGRRPRHAVASTPAVRPEREGAIHVLLRRSLMETRGRRDVAFVELLPRSLGWRSGWHGLIKDLRGEPHGRAGTGDPAFGPYVGPHAVDAAVIVCDSEGDDPSRVAHELQGAAPRGLRGVPRVIVGVAHPCLEAWLLAESGARTRAADELKRTLAAQFPAAKSRRGKCDVAGQVDLNWLRLAFPEFAAVVEELATIAP
ncbi:MAG: hypothetical protein HY906_27540 [Deltaproteobacteria bacterium]|nr:hypothetical protein [Deltaproteobacteria bacterium]